jgi:glycosyl transferase family 87
VKSWYGVRLFFQPKTRQAIEQLVLILVIGYYALFSVTQWLTLTPHDLRFDFQNYFGGAMAAARHTNVYADFERLWGTHAWTVAYIYPPLFALALAPLTPLGLLWAGRVWLLVVHAALVASLWLILRVNPELTPAGRRLFLIAAFLFMPVYLTLHFQQVASLWLLLLTATLWAALRDRDRWAGIMLALAASLKVVPIFLIPLFARLGRWAIAAWAAAALCAITGLTVLVSPGSLDFFTVVLPRLSLGNANWDNGSINGLISRSVVLFPGAFGSQTARVAAAAISASVVIVVGLTLWQAGRAGRDPWQLRLSVAAFIVALLIVSSVTWQHHLVTLLLPLAVGMAWIIERRPQRRYAVGLVVGYLLCWLDRRAFPLPADGVAHSTWQAIGILAGTSVKLCGLLIFWVLLLAMLRRDRRLAIRQPRPAVAGLPPAA